MDSEATFSEHEQEQALALAARMPAAIYAEVAKHPTGAVARCVVENQGSFDKFCEDIAQVPNVPAAIKAVADQHNAAIHAKNEAENRADGRLAAGVLEAEWLADNARRSSEIARAKAEEQESGYGGHKDYTTASLAEMGAMSREDWYAAGDDGRKEIIARAIVEARASYDATLKEESESAQRLLTGSDPRLQGTEEERQAKGAKILVAVSQILSPEGQKAYLAEGLTLEQIRQRGEDVIAGLSPEEQVVARERIAVAQRQKATAYAQSATNDAEAALNAGNLDEAHRLVTYAGQLAEQKDQVGALLAERKQLEDDLIKNPTAEDAVGKIMRLGEVDAEMNRLEDKSRETYRGSDAALTDASQSAVTEEQQDALRHGAGVENLEARRGVSDAMQQASASDEGGFADEEPTTPAPTVAASASLATAAPASSTTHARLVTEPNAGHPDPLDTIASSDPKDNTIDLGNAQAATTRRPLAELLASFQPEMAEPGRVNQFRAPSLASPSA